MLKEKWVIRHNFGDVSLEVESVYIDTESKQEYCETILYRIWLGDIYILDEIKNFHQ